MYGVRQSWGLGDAQNVSMTADDIAACNAHYWLLPIPCWALSPSAWASAAVLNPANLTPGVPLPPVATDSNPTPLTTPPVDAASAQGTVDATVAATTAASQAQILDAVQTNQPYLPADNSPLNPFSDCNESIITGVCDWMLYLGGIGAAALFIFSYARGRR